MIYVSQRVIRTWEAAVTSTYRAECGGMLLGYETVSEQLVITDATLPGPNAKRRLFSYEPDQDWDTQWVAQEYQRSDRIVGYAGEWHSHPFGLLRPSGRDHRTVRLIAEYEAARMASPVSAIVSRSIRGQLRWAVFRSDYESRLFAQSVRVIPDVDAVPRVESA